MDGNPGTGEILLEARDLVLGYGSRKVLEIDALRIEGRSGMMVGLQGPNGTGKSTFLKACLGLCLPTAGDLALLGSIPGARGFRKLLTRVGYVPQARPPGLLRLTAKEVVEGGRYGRIGFLKRSGERDRRAVLEAMEDTGVAVLAHRAIQELSGGQYQRVQIARALAGEPELLLLDEPGSHLDAEGRSGVIKVISKLASERKASMLLVAHDDELLRLADAMLIFADGKVRYRDA